VKVSFTTHFVRDYKKLPESIQEQADKQIIQLMENPKHPSLNIKKMEGHNYIWEARITRGYRMTFQIDRDIYLLRRIGPHSVSKSP
jgi:mRNA-degrading endonuclease RelE of RelBE toxin-antitoxin system